jgi:hypothetical protein
MDITRRDITPAQARDQLLTAADAFTLNNAPIRDWFTATAGGTDAADNPEPQTPWLRTTLGYLSLEMQATYQPTSKTAAVHYVLNWTSASPLATFPPSPSPGCAAP